MKNALLVTLFILTSCASYEGKTKYKDVLNVYYTDAKSERQQGDLFLPKITEKAPVIILIHGGGWDSRSRDDMATIARSLAGHGFIAFNINYRFVPEHKHPAPIEDIASAIKFLKTNESKYNIDLSKIGLWGYSSGAHSAAYYALTHPGISAVVAGGGPYDFTWYPHSPLIKGYMGDYRDQMLDEYFKASASNHVTNAAPPFFMYHGEQDKLVEHAQMMALEAKLKHHKVLVETHTVKFWGHAMTFAIVDIPVKKGIFFLKKILTPQNAGTEEVIR